MFRPAVLFSTHRIDDFVIERFLATQRATAHRAAIHLVVSDADPESFPLPDEVSRSMVFVSSEEMFGPSPGLKGASRVKPGNSDLKLLAGIRRLRSHDYTNYLWIEYDVYCVGCDKAAFDALLDLLATHDLACSFVRPYRQGNPWKWWDSLAFPHVPEVSPWAGFMPIMGVSRPLLESIDRHVRDGASGHYEVLVPRIARMEGFSIIDFACDPHKLVARDQFSAPARVKKLGGLTLTSGIPFVHPIEDAASATALGQTDGSLVLKWFLWTGSCNAGP